MRTAARAVGKRNINEPVGTVAPASTKSDLRSNLTPIVSPMTMTMTSTGSTEWFDGEHWLALHTLINPQEVIIV